MPIMAATCGVKSGTAITLASSRTADSPIPMPNRAVMMGSPMAGTEPNVSSRMMMAAPMPTASAPPGFWNWACSMPWPAGPMDRPPRRRTGTRRRPSRRTVPGMSPSAGRRPVATRPPAARSPGRSPRRTVTPGTPPPAEPAPTGPGHATGAGSSTPRRVRAWLPLLVERSPSGANGTLQRARAEATTAARRAGLGVPDPAFARSRNPALDSARDRTAPGKGVPARGPRHRDLPLSSKGDAVANSKLVGLILDGWEDFDRVLDGLAPEDATRQVEGQSAPAWTLAHTTELVDRWINVGFQGLQAVAGLGDDRYRRGSAGSVESGAWDDIRAAVAEVRQAARAGLESLTDAELEGTFPYVGGDRKSVV